jgi:hypothetical protein
MLNAEVMKKNAPINSRQAQFARPSGLSAILSIVVATATVGFSPCSGTGEGGQTRLKHSNRRF